MANGSKSFHTLYLPLAIAPCRKNIVPHEYRRHFPAEMKDHNSHDILLLCTSCHAASNIHDGVLKQQLSEEFVAPQACGDGVRQLEDPERRRVRSAARALLAASNCLPKQRHDSLQAIVRTFLELNGEQELSSEELQLAAGLETRCFFFFIPRHLWSTAYVLVSRVLVAIFCSQKAVLVGYV